MTRIISLLSILFAAVSVSAQESPFTIKGSFTNAQPDQWAYIRYTSNGQRVLDSTKIVNGTYSFKGNVGYPHIVPVSTNRRFLGGKETALFFLESGDITVNHVDSFSNSKISGSKSHVAYEQLQTILKATNDQMSEVSKKYSAAARAKDEATMKALEPEFDKISELQNKLYEEYLKKNSQSPIGLYVLQQYGGYDIDPVKVEPFYTQLAPSLKNSSAGKQYADRIEKAKKTAVGAMAMDFVQNDTLGVPVKLSSLRGKYLLVDFWASWCGPCRRENPNVVMAFNKYKDKGFHILGVSLDQPGAQDKWIKAIHDDQLAWTQVSDLKYWDNEVAKQYGIQAIPQNFLLDPTGKIIGKNLTGDKLKAKLAELFDGK